MITEAQSESRELRHDHVGVEHFLLGVLRERDSAAAEILRSRGVTIDAFRARMLEIVPVGERERPAELQAPFTPRAKKVLELALREALSLGSDSVAPEHVLLGIARDDSSVATAILQKEWELPSAVIRGAVFESIFPPQSGVIAPDRAVPVPGIVRMERSMGVRVDPSHPVLRLLMAAAALALDDGRTEIEIDDLWLALTREPTALRIATELGIDEQAIRAVIARRGATTEPPEASATG